MNIYQKLVLVFLEHPNTILTHKFLYETAWGVPYLPGVSSNTFRSTMSQIRPLVKGTIAAVSGEGYIYLSEDRYKNLSL